MALALPRLAWGSPAPSSGKPLQPRFLQPGDRIGICSPAGTVQLADLQPAIKQLDAWGFIAVVGSSPGKKHFNFGGTDAERLADLQAMLDAPDLQAILFARGGYGSVRLLEQLSWDRFRKHPKWLIGFSDITVLHAAVWRHTRTASIHARMATGFPATEPTSESPVRQSLDSLHGALTGAPIRYSFPAHPTNRPGTVSGRLVGGSLRNLESLLGTPHALPVKNSLLFLEDTGEYLYNIDRMLWHLKQAHVFDAIRGLILGGFRVKPDDPGEEFGLSVDDMILEKLADLRIPIAFQAPVGHQPLNLAIRCGMPYQLTVAENNATRLESLEP